MKTYRSIQLFLLITLLFFSPSIHATDFTIEDGEWNIQYHSDVMRFDYNYKGKTILAKTSPGATYTLNDSDHTLTASSFTDISYTKEALNDEFGTGNRYTVSFTGGDSPAYMELDICIYDKHEYLTTTLRLICEQEIASNYLAPIASNTPLQLFNGTNNRMLLVPWDNDGFVRYASNFLNTNHTSYEVTAIYDGDSRNGLVLGSLTHDTWKSGIFLNASNRNTINTITCYSGASSDLTRDRIPHGKIKGKTISSAQMFVGFFDDWRIGLETFGHANTLVVPIRDTWKKGTPIGWNSWGVIKEQINYVNVTEIANYYKTHLYKEGFHNEQGNVIIDLDSFWAEGLPTDGLRTQFAADCKSRGQVPGIYWGPFANWGGLDNHVEYTNNRYRFRECTLYSNGQPVTLDGAYCLDPTHPAVKERMREMFAQFRQWGYEYVKLDFMNFGAIQADFYYDKNVTTGIQAYNEGCKYLLEVAGDMFLSLSIAPLFPYQYGNSRRISCDAWGTIGHTEYAMNALTYSWWTDRLYQYNDPDHVVLQGENESEGANRARLTSAAITGMLLLGDNFSTTYTERGNSTLSKARALKLATNPDVLDIVRLGKSFRPVYATNTSTTTADNLFVHHTDQYLYVAAINYYPVLLPISGSIPLSKLGISESQIKSIKELWTGEQRQLQSEQLSYSVPACDARIYRIEKIQEETSLASVEKEKNSVRLASSGNGLLSITSTYPLSKIEVYDIHGRLLDSYENQSYNLELSMQIGYKGFCLIKCYSEGQTPVIKKYIL